jgi:hypothetical protein
LRDITTESATSGIANAVVWFTRRPGRKILGDMADLQAISAAIEENELGLWCLTDPTIDSWKGETTGIKNTRKSKLSPLRDAPEG